MSVELCSAFSSQNQVSIKNVMIGEALVALYDSCGMCSHVKNTMLSTEEGGPWPLVLQ